MIHLPSTYYDLYMYNRECRVVVFIFFNEVTMKQNAHRM